MATTKDDFMQAVYLTSVGWRGQWKAVDSLSGSDIEGAAMRKDYWYLILALMFCANTDALAKVWNVSVGGVTSSGGGDGYGGGYDNPVLAFAPAQLTINAGDSVTFSNLGGAQHNVHADDNSFRCA